MAGRGGGRFESTHAWFEGGESAHVEGKAVSFYGGGLEVLDGYICVVEAAVCEL